jgi:uncharacterized low-complexity protein
MSEKSHRVAKTRIIGTALVTSLTSGIAGADGNPFALKELSQGYQQVAEGEKEKKEMTCGEGKCGAQMMKNPEMKCGAGMQDMMKQQEAEKQKAMEAKCAGMTPGTAAPASPEKKAN